MKITLLLLVFFITVSYGTEVTNVVPGIFSKKVVSNGLHLPATNTFSPITILTTTLHLATSSSYIVSLRFTLQIKNSSASWLLMELMLDHWYTLVKTYTKLPLDYG